MTSTTAPDPAARTAADDLIMERVNLRTKLYGHGFEEALKHLNRVVFARPTLADLQSQVRVPVCST